MNANTPEYWNQQWHSGVKKFPLYTMNMIKRLVPKEASVLDIGCGNGKFLRKLIEEKNCKCFGIDISEVAIDEMRNAGIDGIVTSAENLDSIEGEFDIVTASHIFEHIDNDEGLMRNIARLTKQFAIITVPNDCSYPEETGEHVRKYNLDSLRELALRYLESVIDHTRRNRELLKFHLI